MMTFAEFEAFLKASFPDVTDGMVERFRLHSLAIAGYLRTQRPETYSLFTAPPPIESAKSPFTVTSANVTQTGLRVLDLGTGGGFPGIPLAVMFPNVRFTLCDSVGKKTIVAGEIANMLGLDNVEIVNARAESLPGKFDFVVSRAVASLADFYPWVKGKYSCSILYLKGGDINEEICALMAREHLRKGSVSTWPVNHWLTDPYFEGKFVIDIQR